MDRLGATIVEQQPTSICDFESGAEKIPISEGVSSHPPGGVEVLPFFGEVEVVLFFSLRLSSTSPTKTQNIIYLKVYSFASDSAPHKRKSCEAL